MKNALFVRISLLLERLARLFPYFGVTLRCFYRNPQALTFFFLTISTESHDLWIGFRCRLARSQQNYVVKVFFSNGDSDLQMNSKNLFKKIITSSNQSKMRSKISLTTLFTRSTNQSEIRRQLTGNHCRPQSSWSYWTMSRSQKCQETNPSSSYGVELVSWKFSNSDWKVCHTIDWFVSGLG